MINVTNFMTISSIIEKNVVIGFPASPIPLKMAPNATENTTIPRTFILEAVFKPEYMYFVSVLITFTWFSLTISLTLQGFTLFDSRNDDMFSAEFNKSSKDRLTKYTFSLIDLYFVST